MGFIERNTALERPTLIPEIALYLASEVTPLWQATEASLATNVMPPPFWAFAWVGGQSLARYLLDTPEQVAGRSVFDFGAGSGIVAIAAALAGATEVTAAEIDPYAAAAIHLNARRNGVDIAIYPGDPTRADPIAADVVTAGDICYEQPMTVRAMAWLRAAAGRGSLVLLGDPGRTYLPHTGLVEVARYSVPTTRELEDRDVREGIVYRVLPE